jgi:hypothetical protein
MQHKFRISDAITQLMHLTSEGSFKAAQSKVPRRPTRAPAAPSVPRAGSANAATLALVGVEFEEPLFSWKVVGVGWSEKLDQVVVWYYDVAMAADLELDENEMNLARKTGVDLAPPDC